jgi:D-glycero-alpha-D-manno-heptose-7-phosphate kinase
MIISRAPVRISMGGGGTDLESYYKNHGGFLMAATIDKYIYITVSRRFYNDIRLSYSKTEIVDTVADIEHKIFQAALNMTNLENQIEIVSIADIPSKCGLGTSSTFTVALLNGLLTYKKMYPSLNKLAEKACHLEIDILKEPIGKQDQYASAFGGFNAYWFNQDGSVDIEPVGIKYENLLELQNNLLLFSLNSERSASNILNEQNEKSKSNDIDVIARLHKIKQLGLDTKRVFEQGKIEQFGEILHEHWITKKKLSKGISNPLIDEAYDLALNNGAIGGKVVGAGGGGFLMLYAQHHKAKLVNALKKLGLSPMWFNFEYQGAKIIFNG